MNSPDRPRSRRIALVIAFLVVLAALVVIWRSRAPSAPASTAEGAPTLDPSAWPEIHTELVASTELTWNPRTDWDPGADVVIASGGDLFVSQWRDWNILVIDETGDIVRTFGRKGEGPGEFVQLSAIWLMGDTLFATDRGLLRVNHFDTDGQFLHSRRWPADIPMHTKEFVGYRVLFSAESPPSTILSNGLALAIPNVTVMAFQGFPAAGIQSNGFRIPFLTMDEDGQIVDTLAWDEGIGTVFGMARGGQVYGIQVPFLRGSRAAVMPGGGGAVVVRQDDSAGPEVAVTRIGPAADTVFSRTYAYTPIPLTDASLRSALDEARVFARSAPEATANDRAPEGADFEGPLRRSGALPATLPAVSGLAVGQDGSIWLRREETDRDFVQWAVLDGTGQVLGVVTLPRGQEVVAARETVMVAVEEDELGLANLVRYRLRSPIG